MNINKLIPAFEAVLYAGGEPLSIDVQVEDPQDIILMDDH